MTIALVLAISTALAGAEIVEEETWFNADGQVVKTVKRTYTGRDADGAPDWEPAWVIRERNHGTSSRWSGAVSARHVYGGHYYRHGYRYRYPRLNAGHYRYQCSRPVSHYGHRFGTRGGFAGYYGSVGGRSVDGFRYSSPRLSIHYCR
jgi:hypothetical protein